MLSQNVTIVIPCKNEEAYIGNLLDDLANQYDIVGTRIIIADDSNDRTQEIIDEKIIKYKDVLDIEVVEGGTVSKARNNGAWNCQTEYIGFIDADVRLFNRFTLLDSILHLKKEEILLVTCKLKSYGTDFRTHIGFYLYNKILPFFTKKYPFAIGAYLFTDYKIFRQIGGFDERNDNSEDFLFSQKYQPHQFKILDHFIGQDDRRFKKMGYIGMVRHLLVNFYKFKVGDKEHFTYISNYWNNKST